MKKLATFLNLTLCLELVLMPLNQSLITSRPVEANTCSTGQQWDANLGRCLTDVETAKVMQATASCDAKDIECYKKNAKEAFDKKVESGEAPGEVKNKGFVSTIGKAGSVAGALFSATAFFKTKPAKCAAISHGMIIAGGVTTFVGEMFANNKHKKNLKEIEKEWNQIVNTNYDGTDKDSKKAHASAAQGEAFEMMAKAEDSIADNSKTKTKIHMAATAMYAAAGIAAGLEIYAEKASGGTGKLATMCKSTPAPTGTYNPPKINYLYASNEYERFNTLQNDQEFESYLFYNQKRQYLSLNILENNFESFFTVFTSTQTQSSPTLDEYLAANEVGLDQETKTTVRAVLHTMLGHLNPFPASAHATVISSEGLGKLLESPWTRLGLSTVLAGWSLIMMKHTKSQTEASTNRAELLRKMKSDFLGAAATINMCTPEDRSNTNKPECYCYNSDGQRSTNRSNSQICQKLWNGSLASAQSYKNSSNAFAGCINSANEHDPVCACKKSSKGCLTVSTKGISGISTGALSMLNSGVSPVNEIATGNFAAATASDSASLNNAMRTVKALDKMLDQPDIKKEIKDKDKFLAGIETAAAKGSNGNYSDGLNGNSFSGSAGQAVASLEKELEAKAPELFKTEKGSAPLAGASKAKGKGIDFDFGSNDNQEQIDGQVAQVMNQNFDYSQNDINNQSHTNIFELLSNRYQRSALRRLFDDEGKSKAEAPSNSDISN